VLSKQDVATSLNISTRTVERCTKQGRLAVTYITGRGKPKPMYQETDVECLRQSLSLEPRFQAQVEATGVPHISTRLPEHYFVRLEEKARQHGLTVTAYARFLIIDALERTEANSPTNEIQVVHQSVKALHQSLRTATMALLMYAATVTNEDEARAWVSENLECPD